MNTTKHFRGIAVIIAVSLISAVNVEAQLSESARWIPESVNSLVIVRADKVLESQIATQENWKVDRMKMFQSGATFLPPSTKLLLMGAQIDFEYMEPITQVAVFEKSGKPINMLEVSKLSQGNLEQVDQKDAVLLPNDAYLVKIDDDTLVSMTPANRQVTSRWLRSKQFGTMNLSNYLTEAVNFAETNAQIIVAFDFQDVLKPDVIKERLKDSAICTEDELGGVCTSLEDIRGMTLGITINDKITGAIKIDFKSSPANLAKVGKELLIYALEKHGVMIEDIRNWDMRVNGNQLLMMGPLSRMGLRQIGSLIEHPLIPDFEGGSGGGQNPVVDMKTRSMQYFGSIQTLIKELRSKDFQAMTTYSKFFDKYARQIDNLSVINVDPVVLSYGTYVADSFREVSGGLLDVNLQKVRDRQTYEAGSSTYHGRGNYSNYNGYTSRYGWGPSGYSSNLRNRQRVSGEAKLQGEIGAKNIMREVDAQTAEVKRQMSEKYNVEF